MKTRQRGATFFAWVLVAALVSVVALLAVRIVPAYVDYRTIITVIEALPADRVQSMSKGEIKDTLQKRFLINNIRDLTVGDVMDIQKKREGTVVVLKYEIREHLLYNVWVVIAFDRSFNYQ